MFLFNEPDKKSLEKFLENECNDDFSYAEIGASRSGVAPKNYTVDHNRIKIGEGKDDYEKACAAVRNWKMFDFSWIRLFRDDTPIETGATVAIIARHLGFWSLNASRIVYVLDERGEIEKYGFAYGTLSEHAERGEERFSVEWHHATDEVWYDLYAFSQTNSLIAKIGYPFARAMQKSFAVESKAAMIRAVRGNADTLVRRSNLD